MSTSPATVRTSPPAGSPEGGAESRPWRDELLRVGVRVSLRAGETLFLQDEESDGAYLVVEGRLRASSSGTGNEHGFVVDLGVGEIVGEHGLITGEPRSASVHAVRDTVLTKVGRSALETIMAQRPEVALELSRLALGRVRRARRPSPDRIFALVAVSPGLGLEPVGAALVSAWGKDARMVHEQVEACELAALELEHGHLALVTSGVLDDWTRLALRNADRVVLVAEATADPEPGPFEDEVWRAISSHARPTTSLVLLHGSDVAMPSGTAAWLDPRRVDSHHHVRRGDQATLARLARLLDGTASAVVLGGGGARGMGHLGVLEVLEECDVPVDLVAGTSIGSIIATGPAMMWGPEESRARAVAAFRNLLDYTVPTTAVLKGRRITKALRKGMGETRIEDLWVPYFCISTNLTTGAPHVHERGDLVTAVRASIAIPGVLPPVTIDGELHVDGGVLDNLPVEQMRRRNPTGTIVAVDVASSRGPTARTPFGLWTSGLGALLARRRGGGPPRLLTILTRATTIAGTSGARESAEHADLVLDLDLPGVSMLDFADAARTADRAAAAARDAVRGWAEGGPGGHMPLPAPPARETPLPHGRGSGWAGVLLLTARDLRFRSTRFASAIIGTSVVCTLLFLMTGLSAQLDREPRDAVASFGAEWWVVPSGASGVFTSAATFAAATAARVPAGAPILAGRFSIGDDQAPVDVVVIGYQRGGDGQPTIVSGRLPAAAGEVTIDASYDARPGDKVTLGRTTYDVVGLTRDSTLLAGMPLVSMRLPDARDLLARGEPVVSAVLLDQEPTALPEGLQVLPADAIAEDAARPLEGAISSVNLVRSLLWLVTAMIIAAMTYLSALDRRRDMAVLKAMGASNVQMGTSIALQGVTIAIAAVTVAAGLQALIAPAFPLPVALPASAYLTIPLLAVGVALLAGLLGLRSAVRTDPALAFSGPGT